MQIDLVIDKGIITSFWNMIKKNDMQNVNDKVAAVVKNRIHVKIHKTSKVFALAAPMNVKL